MKDEEEKILFVDDEEMLLSSVQRMLRKRFSVHTALGGQAGLDAIQERGPFSVVLSDMQMPEMTGVQFLEKVQSLSKESVRMMLTGNADQQTAVAAINTGAIFRFINKPAERDSLIAAIEAGLEQHRLITAEKRLLSRTLVSSVGVMSDVLSIVRPDVFGRATGIRELVRTMCSRLQIENRWEIELAASLSQLGYISLSTDMLDDLATSRFESVINSVEFQQHTIVGSEIIEKVPRLEGVATLIRLQNKGYDGSGVPPDHPSGTDLPIGVRILKVAHDFDLALQRFGGQPEAYAWIKQNERLYDPEILKILDELFELGAKRESILIRELRPGMVLESNVLSGTGDVLIASGRALNELMIEKLVSYSREKKVKEPIEVRYYLGSESTST